METTAQTIAIEIQLEELEEDDEGFGRAAPADALTGAVGSGRFRFTARATDVGADFVGSPFTMPRSSAVELAEDMEADLEARVRLAELDTALTTAGWRTSPDRGMHWWSLRYTKD